MPDPVPSADTVDAESVLAQLQRILASEAFARAPIMRRLLGFVVERAVGEATAPLKEYTIGVEVFRRGPEFDPRVDTIVRVHARRLRNHLAKYYAGPGRADPVVITIPKGHYRAEIAPRRCNDLAASPTVDAVSRRPPEAGGQRLAFRGCGIPAPRTPLVGRGADVEALTGMLAADVGARLVTLTGTAGSGKTRLAIEIGMRWQSMHPGGVMFVGLASVTDVQILQLALLRAFGLRVTDECRPLETLCRHLHRLECAPLLILDNFEQLADAAPVVGALLDASPSLKALVTSRVALHLYGEHEYPVAPLALPDDDRMPPEALRQVPAIDLFVQRVAAVHAGFALTAGNARAVAQICRRFDGLPLGIELAAAQCRLLAPEQWLERLPERLEVSAGNVADVCERQRTLGQAIAWSHDLLSEPLQRLFRRVSVFAGGFTLAAAEAVAAGATPGSVPDIHEGLVRLLDNHLLQQGGDAAEPRYIMLETIRDYARQQLVASGEAGRVYRAHAAHFLELAEQGGKCPGLEYERWLDRCDHEQHNFRDALDGLVERNEIDVALRLVCALFGYWERRERVALAHRAVEQVLGRLDPMTEPVPWARLAGLAATVESAMGMHEAALAHVRRGLAMARACGARAVELSSLGVLAAAQLAAGDQADGLATYREALDLCEAAGLACEAAGLYRDLALALQMCGEFDAAEQLLERALASFRRLRAPREVAWCLHGLAEVAMAGDRYALAERRVRQAVRRFLQLEDCPGAALALVDLGWLALRRGDTTAATTRFASALELHACHGPLGSLASLLEGCAALEVARQDFAQALVLAGAAASARSGCRIAAAPHRHARFEQAIQVAQGAVSATQAVSCHHRGMSMSAPEAIDCVRRSLEKGAPVTR